MRAAPIFQLDELARLRRALDATNGNLVCIYGRRRLGKSRLLTAALAERKAVYYVADERDGAVQRHDLAQEMDRVVPGMGAVTYPSWLALLEAWWRQATAQSVLAIDELPWLAAAAPELPSLLQKLIDRRQPRHVVLCGSSSRMMHGLVLDSAAPLFGRATEILPLAMLVDLGFLRRDTPFGTPTKDAKRSLYKIADPLLDFFSGLSNPTDLAWEPDSTLRL